MKAQTLAIVLMLSTFGAPVSARTPGPEETVDAFSAALQAGDGVRVGALMAADALVAEEGGAEQSFAEYQAAHLPADIEFSKSVTRRVTDRRVWTERGMATVVTAADMTGVFRGRAIASRTMETMVLMKTNGEWRITHIHWSSAPMAPTPVAN